MRAAVVPELHGTWELRHIAEPGVEPGQVLIKVHACGICYTDVWTTFGAAGDIFPQVPGHEVVGEVVAVGPGVTSRKVGDRVGLGWVQSTCGRCDYCRQNRPLSGQAAVNCDAPRLTGFTAQGGNAEHIAASAEGTVLIPDGLSYEDAAPVFCAGYTAWCGLRLADPRPDQRVGVLGIGGLGHFALQFSKAFGHETVAITQSPDKTEAARRMGADLVVADGEELAKAGGVDVLLMTSNSYRLAEKSMRALRPDGCVVIMGIAGKEPFQIPVDAGSPFFAQRQRVLGSTHNGLEYLTEALEIVASGRVTPQIEVFDPEEIQDAFDRVADGDIRFRAVVRWNR